MATRKSASSAKKLATYVHVPIDEAGTDFVAFPAGTAVGDKVKIDGREVQFTAAVAEKITNPKAWTSEDADEASDAAETDGE